MMNMDNVSNLVMSGVESAAQMSIGQAVLRLIDRMLWVIEKSVQWSLPTQEITSDENGKSFGKVELVRPLPWILFLPGLLILRVIRIGLDAAAGILGYSRTEPSDMVRIIQRSRRRLRAVKSSGLKSMRLKKPPVPVIKDRAMTMKEASKSLAKSIRLTLSTLSCLDSGSKTSPSPPPTKIRVCNILDTTPPVEEEKGAIDSAIDSAAVSPVDSKRKYSEISSDETSDDESDEEPLISKIDRLANTSGSDKDFSVDECSSANVSDSSSESEADVSISMSEVQDLKQETDEMEKMWCANPRGTVRTCDNELHKLTEALLAAERTVDGTALAPSTNGSKDQQEQESQLEEVEEKPKVLENDLQHSTATPRMLTLTTTNGLGPNDIDTTAYYSPISWKSVSPELEVSPDKQDNQVDSEGKPEELNNGEVNEKNEKDYDSNKPCPAPGGEVANGHVSKDKQQRTSSQSGGSGNSSGGKHHPKNKRGNHGSRKKK